ncbi:MAG TPA: hypothetical protein VF066_02140, partial [Thermoleophilaceae bacterium]
RARLPAPMLSDRFRAAVERGNVDLITELKVMIRPASALQLVGAKLAEELPRVGLGPTPRRGEPVDLR